MVAVPHGTVLPRMDEMPMVKRLRILVANEPRAYRDAHGGMLREMYPDFDVRLSSASNLESVFRRFAPHLVICSSVLDAAVKEDAFAWVLLYPDEADLAVVCINDQQSVIEAVTIQDLIGVVEAVAREVGLSGRSIRGKPAARMVAEDSAEFDSSEPYCQKHRL